MDLVLATRNEGKLSELSALLDGLPIRMSSLRDYPEISEIVEDGSTFLDNARKKAMAVLRATGKWALADDSGLEVAALGSRPGVKSARYASRQGDYAANNRKLLDEMRDIPEGRRGARFVCSMVLASPGGREWVAEGRCEGTIMRGLRGGGGFGYDPLFYIQGEGATMAELPMDVKNRISHRGLALAKIREILVEILRENKTNA